MSWQLKFIERDKDGNLPGGYEARKPGDIWYEPGIKDSKTRNLSDWYYQHNAHREPFMICLPGDKWQDIWWVDAKSNDGQGWQVTGEPTNLTASPSIMTEQYHGFLRDGILTDDLEGRQYKKEE